MDLQEACGRIGQITLGDDDWDDPLPHALMRRSTYLNAITSKTKAVLVCMHGRGEAIDDMVGGVFLPTFARHFGGKEGKVCDEVDDDDDDDDDDEEEEERLDVKHVSIVGIEARDNEWYPYKHGAREGGEEARMNAPFQYSALDLLRRTLFDLVFHRNVPPERIVYAGFSQGAILANMYVKAALQLCSCDQRTPAARTPMPPMPIPGQIFSLAGSLCGVQPNFPSRTRFGSQDGLEAYRKVLQREVDVIDAQNGWWRLTSKKGTVLHLICGTNDPFFPLEEIHQCAKTLVEARESALNSKGSFPSTFAHGLQIGVGMEEGAPHVITSRMIAALVRAIEEAIRE